MANMKARNIREDLFNKVDPELLRVLIGLAEDNSVIQHQINEITSLLNQAIVNVGVISAVAGKLSLVMEEQGKIDSNVRATLNRIRYMSDKDVTARLQRIRGNDDDNPNFSET